MTEPPHLAPDCASRTDEQLGGWELWRQDDNGNRALVARFGTESRALEKQRRFEARGHKQTYWVDERAAC